MIEFAKAISNEEMMELEEFLLEQELEYPNYEGWIKNTIQEIKEGNKQAFCIFQDDQIVGDLVSRRSSSGVAEVKNFYIDPEFQEEGFGRELLGKFEEDCSSRGVSEVVTDALVEKTDMVTFLINQGYEIKSTHKKYGMEKSSYIFKKKIEPTYSGPLDWEEMSRWVVSEKWGWELVEKHPEFGEKKFDGLFKTNRGDIELALVLEAKGWFSSKVGLDEVTTLIHCAERANVLVYSAPDFGDRAKNELESRRGCWIDRKKMEDLTKREIREKRGEKFGYLQPIKPEFYDRLLKKEGRMAFVKGGRGGLKTEVGDYLVLYETSPVKAINGLMEIERQEFSLPEKVWGDYHSYLVFNEEEFRNWSGEKDQIMVFVSSKLEEVEEIPYSNLKEILGSFSPMGGQYLSTREWGALREES